MYNSTTPPPPPPPPLPVELLEDIASYTLQATMPSTEMHELQAGVYYAAASRLARVSPVFLTAIRRTTRRRLQETERAHRRAATELERHGVVKEQFAYHAGAAWGGLRRLRDEESVWRSVEDELKGVLRQVDTRGEGG